MSPYTPNAMGLFRTSLAKRLRRGPALLLPADPGERLLAAVRRFDPEAEPGDGFIELSFCLLTGPIEGRPDLAGKVAYLPEHASDHEVNASLLVAGLAHLLGGTQRPAKQPVPDDMWIDPVVSVFTRDLLPQGDLREVAAPYVPNFQAIDVPQAEYGVEGEGPIFIEYGAMMSYDPAAPPPRVRQAPYECRIFVLNGELPMPAELLRQAGELALAVAERADGVALDVNGFRVERPEDVYL